MRRPSIRGGVAVGLALLVAGCQPTGEPQLQPSLAPDAPASRPLGNPVGYTLPGTLEEVTAFGHDVAATWQDDAVLADLTVWLDERRRWQEVRLTYIAQDAGRLLTVRADTDGVEQQRPALGGLEMIPVPEAAVAAVEPFPPDAREPAALGDAARQALEACGWSGPIRAVVYATGAPAAWDGSRWTDLPVWRATVATAEGGALVDPVTGAAFAPQVCVGPLRSRNGGAPATP